MAVILPLLWKCYLQILFLLMLGSAGRLPAHFYDPSSKPADSIGHSLRMIYGTWGAGSVPSTRHMQQKLGHVFSPWNKHLTEYLSMPPLTAAAMIIYFFFKEVQHFFGWFTLSPQYALNTFHARQLCDLISAQQETETSSRVSTEAAGSWSQNEFLVPLNLGELKSLKARGVPGRLMLHQGAWLLWGTLKWSMQKNRPGVGVSRLFSPWPVNILQEKTETDYICVGLLFCCLFFQ